METCRTCLIASNDNLKEINLNHNKPIELTRKNCRSKWTAISQKFECSIGTKHYELLDDPGQNGKEKKSKNHVIFMAGIAITQFLFTP